MLEHTIDPDNALVRVTGHGRLEAAACDAAMRRLVRHPLFRPTYPILLDLTRVEQAPSLDQLRALMAAFKQGNDTFASRVAVLVKGGMALVRAKAACMAAVLWDMEMKAFTSAAAARAWLAKA